MFKAHSFSIFILLAIGLSGCGGSTAPATGTGTGTVPAASSAAGGAASSDKKSGRKVIAVVPKSNAHEFWRQVEAGALSAAKDKHVDILFKAGEPGDDANAQLTLVDRLIAQGVDAIVLAPVHAKFLVQAVEKCNEKNIPIVIIDSGVDIDFNKYVSFVATDNKDGGKQCAQKLAELLGRKGDILLFRYAPGSASTQEREEGFTEELKNSPNIKVIAEKYAGATREDALRSANELLAANPKFDGVFACNESSTMGMLLALREKNLAGKVKFVGFDTAKELLEAVEKGEIDALAAQNPFLIGSDGVTQALAALNKEKTTPSIVIAAVLADKESIRRENEIKEKIRKETEEVRRLQEAGQREAEESKKKADEQVKELEARQKAEEARKSEKK